MKKLLAESVIEEIFLRSWWVLFILFLCFGLYEHEHKKRNETSAVLTAQKNEIQYKKIKALENHDYLLTQINSQADPAWIELVLMKKLGLVPEGQTKIFFQKSTVL
jgi:hypothetical protein